ncbi:hypothetical protein C8K38_111235 [Rhodococcus sp. OK611]|uniref:hypothetical protein n=1 Tax=unclassified Rhodococcus (in: high G+C Gram-positive bacteria) TaxID=192944 RepID=UPI000BC8FB99|nr:MULTISPECIES: hypothetical protein [unclassified Rhodococcus (in: high G+C Gram-positive bacteria)]PTR42066.1 hypothetical protein C8K38_111235 [Rhodococcus sp. OK611]SNX91487.1 hypothetical protein SAMN05447004_11022 [Rhodococcus sp. OK270]
MSAPEISLAGFAAALDEQAASLAEAGVDGSEDYMFRSESLALAKLSAETAVALAERQAQIDEQGAATAPAAAALERVRQYAAVCATAPNLNMRIAGQNVLAIIRGEE